MGGRGLYFLKEALLGPLLPVLSPALLPSSLNRAPHSLGFRRGALVFARKIDLRQRDTGPEARSQAMGSSLN